MGTALLLSTRWSFLCVLFVQLSPQERFTFEEVKDSETYIFPKEMAFIFDFHRFLCTAPFSRLTEQLYDQS